MEPFKNLISPDLVRQIAWYITRHMPEFDEAAFCAAAIPQLDALEMKAWVGIGEIAFSTTNIAMGEMLEFTANITSTGVKPQNLSIDYVVHFRKANGSTAPKVFKGGKAKLAPAEA